jgi:hypothetical protein
MHGGLDDKHEFLCELANVRRDEYGSFYQGALCIHDPKLLDRFSASNGVNKLDVVLEKNKEIERLHDELSNKRAIIVELQRRLTAVEA